MSAEKKLLCTRRSAMINMDNSKAMAFMFSYAIVGWQINEIYN